MRVVFFLVAIFVVSGCGPASSPKPRSFVNQVWQVKRSSSVAQGQLYVFLSDGTLVMASDNGTPALGSWTYEDSVLTMVEEGIPYTTDILELSDSVFSIRSHNPGHPVDIVLVPADQTPPAAVRAVVSAGFSVPHAELGTLSLENGKLAFKSCDAGSPAREITDVPTGEARTLLRDVGGSKSLSALVRLDGSQLREIRYAGPPEIPCDRILAAGEIQAKGNEPFWSAEVDQGEIVVKTPEQPSGVRYRTGFWTHPDPDHWIFQAARQDSGRVEKLKLALAQVPCFDSMSGARFPFRALLDREGKQVTGCALEGRKGVAR